MLGQSGTLYLAHMNFSGMEPTVGKKFPFNKNVYFGATMKEAMDKGRAACGNDEAECEKYLGLMQVEFERGKEANGDSPDTFYVTKIMNQSNWSGTEEKGPAEPVDRIQKDEQCSVCSAESEPAISTTPWHKMTRIPHVERGQELTAFASA